MPLIEVGSKAPAFELRDQDGKRHALKDFAGRVVVLYFYPKDDTSGCTDQACQFRDHLPDFRKIKAVVLGVSPDDEKSHAMFAAKHDLGFTLLADTQRDANDNPKVCEAYGVWGEKTMYGKPYMGVTRTTYLIDGDGVVQRRWDKVSVKGHVAEVLAAVKELGGVKGGAGGKHRKGAADSNPPFSPVRGPGAPKQAIGASGPLLSMVKGGKGGLGGAPAPKQSHGTGGGAGGGARRPAGGAKTGVPRRPGGKRGG